MTVPMRYFAISPLTGMRREPDSIRRPVEECDIHRLQTDLGDLGAVVEETEQHRSGRERLRERVA